MIRAGVAAILGSLGIILLISGEPGLATVLLALAAVMAAVAMLRS